MRGASHGVGAVGGTALGECAWVAEADDRGPAPRMMAAQMAVDPGQVEQVVSLITRWRFADRLPVLHFFFVPWGVASCS